MTRVRIDLAYDGTPFHGFARQPDPDLPTVQGTLEGALSRLTGEDVRTVCAGRTDRGVHALAQVVHVDLDDRVDRVARFLQDAELSRRRLDRLVGDAITIWSVRRTDDGFDARFSAVERRYRYRMTDAELPDPLRRHDRWHVEGPLDVDAMRAGGQHLVGEHDFASFCRRAPGRHTVRRVDALTVEREDDEVVVRLRGPAFCHQQVRSVVGCLVDVGRGRRTPDWVRQVLEARDRSRAAPVAPPHGLVLVGVRYAGHPDAGT